MSKIYTADGWINWDYIIGETKAFCMVVGARGIGKTYGLFKNLLSRKEKFLYVRRLKTQLDECGKIDGNPFRRINSDEGYNIQPYRNGSGIRFCESEEQDGKFFPSAEPIALGVALSTFATVRGADYSDINYIVFDESIAMLGERPIKDEFSAFLNFYETVNRNRELEGKQAVKCFLLGNANKLGNPYFSGWHFMRTALKMIAGKQMMYRSPDGNRIMILLMDSPISARKAETALYQNAGSDFMSMALDNAFRTDATNIRSLKLKELTHIVSIGEVGVYRHKSNRQLYVSKTVQQSPYYDSYGIRLTMFRRDYALLKYSYLSGRMIFEDYECELIFREYIDII